MPRRFSTWFFVADLPAGAEPVFEPDEVAGHAWLTPSAALEQLAAGEIEMWVPDDERPPAARRDGRDVRRRGRASGSEFEPDRAAADHRGGPATRSGSRSAPPAACPGRPVRDDAHRPSRARPRRPGRSVRRGDPPDRRDGRAARRRDPRDRPDRARTPITRPARRRSRSRSRSRSSSRPAPVAICRTDTRARRRRAPADRRRRCASGSARPAPAGSRSSSGVSGGVTRRGSGSG